MIPATQGPKIPENGPEPEFRPEFLLNFEPIECVNEEYYTSNTMLELGGLLSLEGNESVLLFSC